MRAILTLLCLLFINGELMTQSLDIKAADFYAELDASLFPNESEYNSNGLPEGDWVIYELREGGIYISAAEVTGEKRDTLNGEFLIRMEGQFHNGKKMGLWTLYWVKKSAPFELVKFGEQLYESDVLVGEWNYYDLLGQQISTIRHDSAGFKVEEISYYANSTVSERVVITDGEYSGIWYQYDTSGNLVSEATYRNKELTGPVKYYYPSGALQLAGSFLLGQFDGEIMEYLENGQVIKKYSYRNGALNGTYSKYSEEGILEFERNYVDGQADGLYQYYYPNGQVWIAILFSNGKHWEVVGNYDQEGNEREKGSLDNGNGTIFYYHEDGRLREVTTFRNGEKVNTESRN